MNLQGPTQSHEYVGKTDFHHFRIYPTLQQKRPALRIKTIKRKIGSNGPGKAF